MSQAAAFVQPVAILREQVTALEAAMTVALADPAKRPVHQMRTTTRRIEAQLGLLKYLGLTPADTRAVRDAGRALRRIRRAAGRVRDLDVHADLVRAYGSREPDETTGSAEHDARLMERVRRDADMLSEALGRRRERGAEKLVRMLARERTELAPALEELLKALEASADLMLSPARLEESTRGWYALQEEAHRVPERTADELHATRKAAKMARYLAESSAETASLARQFEEVQESGGRWHDLLTLAETAEETLRRKSPLRTRLRSEARAAREAYRTHLRDFRSRRGATGSPRVRKGSTSRAKRS